jgi:hypothetical protein
MAVFFFTPHTFPRPELLLRWPSTSDYHPWKVIIITFGAITNFPKPSRNACAVCFPSREREIQTFDF